MELAAGRGKPGLFPPPPETEEYFLSLVPVSYTHLDVYKRQVYHFYDQLLHAMDINIFYLLDKIRRKENQV